MKSKNKTTKLAFSMGLSDELDTSVIMQILIYRASKRFSLNGANIDKGKTNDDFSRGYTTHIVSKYINRGMAAFRKVFKKNI